jgi:dihydroxyacetone kinase phosphotransfer subunit
LVGLVLISHSGTLAEGLRDMVAQVAGDEVAVGIAGGTDDGRLGTSAPRIGAALQSALARSPEGVLVLLDLGSAALSLELALEDLEPLDRERVHVSEAPLVEGAILAAVQASVGASLAEVAAAAEGAATMSKIPKPIGS